jgi:hypothetical protein
MKTTTIYVAISALNFIGCNNEGELFHTEILVEDVKMEIHVDPGGVYGADYYSYFITDSKYFSHLVGRRSESGCITYGLISDDTVFVNLYKNRGRIGLIDSTSYSISALLLNGKKKSPFLQDR